MIKTFNAYEKRELNRRKKESFLMFVGATIFTILMLLIACNKEIVRALSDGAFYTLIFVLINSSFCVILNIVELITLNIKTKAD